VTEEWWADWLRHFGDLTKAQVTEILISAEILPGKVYEDEQGGG
jgi:hypothetical protein